MNAAETEADTTTAAARAAGETAETDDGHGYFPSTRIANADGTVTVIFGPQSGAAVESDMPHGWIIDRMTAGDDPTPIGPPNWADPATTPEEIIALATKDAS